MGCAERRRARVSTGWARGALLVCLAAGALACAGPISRTDDGYRHRKHDYEIAAPDGPGPGWQAVEVEDAALTFRREGRDSISLVSRCGRPVTDAQVMARHLVIGLPSRELLAAGPVEVASFSGWTQTFRTRHAGVPVHIKTVTLVVRNCSFDWILAAAGPFEEAEAAFDAWWRSFRLDAYYYEEPQT